MSTELDVIALARAAGLCFADCHFLDLDPYEDLLETMAQYDTEAERDAYLATVRREDQQRRLKLHQLECFAAAVLRHATARIEDEVQHWHADNFDVWSGAAKVCTRLEFQALALEEQHKPLAEALN